MKKVNTRGEQLSTLKPKDWHSRDRFSKLANTLYPHLADTETLREMKEILRREGKGNQIDKLIKERERKGKR
jgi:hypothetical protein